MIKCYNCDNIFDESDLIIKDIWVEAELGVSDAFDSSTHFCSPCCPHCKSTTLIPLQQCDCCEEWFEELNDTEGMINGNIGYVCDQCFKDSEVCE